MRVVGVGGVVVVGGGGSGVYRGYSYSMWLSVG